MALTKTREDFLRGWPRPEHPEVELEVGDMFRAGACRFALLEVAEVELEVLATDRYGQLHGSCLAMRELYTQIDKLAPTPLDILLLGETGTGKERTAQTIHRASRRRGPLVVLDCGTLSPTLAEGTLFGFRKGAFTGADRDQAGVFEAADGGTLFIDEVGELALDHQVKLLRALDKREVTRLGEPGSHPDGRREHLRAGGSHLECAGFTQFGPTHRARSPRSFARARLDGPRS